MNLFLTTTQLFTSQDVIRWTGVVWITCDVLPAVSFLRRAGSWKLYKGGLDDILGGRLGGWGIDIYTVDIALSQQNTLLLNNNNKTPLFSLSLDHCFYTGDFFT